MAAESQRARVVMRHCEIIRIMVLNLPILSAKRPGAHLPKKEPALRIERSWYDKVGLMPASRAKEIR